MDNPPILLQSVPEQAIGVPATRLSIEHRYSQLDVLRGIAIFGVFLDHCLWPLYNHPCTAWDGMRLRFAPGVGNEFWPLFPFTYGWAGVPLFFVLSGFVIHNSFLRTKRFDAKAFFWRRFWRIYPPYVIALVFFTVVALHMGGGVRTTFIQFVLHLFAVHNFSQGSFFSINGVFWSLAVEIQFYLLYPLVLWMRERCGIRGALLITGLISVASHLVCYCITDWNQPIRESVWGLTTNSWFLWVLGAYVAEAHETGRRMFKHPLVLMLVLAAVFVLASMYKPTSVLCFPIAGVASAALIDWAMHCRPWTSIFAKALTLLGLCSYSMYLWHQPFLPKLARIARAAHFHAMWLNMLLLVLIGLLTLFPASYALYITIEAGGQRLGRLLLQRKPKNALP